MRARATASLRRSIQCWKASVSTISITERKVVNHGWQIANYSLHGSKRRGRIAVARRARPNQLRQGDEGPILGAEPRGQFKEPGQHTARKRREARSERLVLLGAKTVTLQARVARARPSLVHFLMPLGGASLARAQERGLVCPCVQQVSLTSGISDPLASAYGSSGHLPSRSASALAGVQGDAR
jgi:hypothetical protein